MSQRGFTLVELIMALAFFSFMMALLSIGVIQIMNIYQANLASRRTQQAARVSMEDITREVRNASRIAFPPGSGETADRLCLEGSRPVEYTRLSDQLIKKVGGTSCNDLAGAASSTMIGSSGENDANSNLKLRVFKLAKIQSASGQDTSVKISMTVTTGADDLFEQTGVACKPGVTGSQFCATTEFTNVASLRGSP